MQSATVQETAVQVCLDPHAPDMVSHRVSDSQKARQLRKVGVSTQIPMTFYRAADHGYAPMRPVALAFTKGNRDLIRLFLFKTGQQHLVLRHPGSPVGTPLLHYLLPTEPPDLSSGSTGLGFSRSTGTSLPTHRLYDCSIDYSLS